jgi:16S rRNA (guanine966-N2)-methyltransferase
LTRIISGTARGRRLAVPPGTGTRPTGDRAREALFSALDAQLGGFDGLAVLDLFAGSGAVGLEALSRGARHVLLVESDQRAAAVVGRNLDVVRPDRKGARIVTDRAERVVADGPLEGPYDMVFLDPPYAFADADVTKILTALDTGGWLADEAVIVLERSSRDPEFAWPEGYEPTRSKTYGEARLAYAVWYVRGAPD